MEVHYRQRLIHRLMGVFNNKQQGAGARPYYKCVSKGEVAESAVTVDSYFLHGRTTATACAHAPREDYAPEFVCITSPTKMMI
jgi:hypothetical protein